MTGKHSFYNKLVLYGCSACIIPLLILGFFSYINSSRSIQRHVDQSNVQLMDQMNANMEQTLRTLDYSLNNFINSTLIQEALYNRLTSYEFETYNAIRKALTLHQSAETKVTDIVVMNSFDNWIITNTGLYKLDEYAHKDALLSFKDLLFDSNWLLLPNHSFGFADTESSACKSMIALVKKMPLNTSEKRGLLIASIPECSLASMMENSSDSHEVMVLDKAYRIIIHPDESKIGLTLKESGLLQEKSLKRIDGKSGQFRVNWKGKDSTFTYIRSDFNGWTYVSVNDIAETTKEARSIGWFTLYVLFGIIGLSILFVWFGSRRMYTPIRGILKRITERLPDNGTGVPRKNELQFIDEQFRDLFSSNSRLQGELYQTGRQIRNFFLVKLYHGNVGSRELEEQLERFGYLEQVSSWDQLAVLTVQIDQLKVTRFEQNDLDLLLFAINNMIEELIPAANRLIPIIVEQTQVTTIGYRGLTFEEFTCRLYKWTEDIQQTIRAYLELNVSIGISLPFQHMNMASRAYREGIEALKHRLNLGEGVIIPYASLNAGKHKFIYAYPKLQECELIDAVKLADASRSLELLKQWMHEVFHKERPPHEYQISLIRLLNNIMIVMEETGVRLEQLDLKEGSLYEELLRLFVGSEIEAWFKDRIILPMIGVLRERQESQYQNLSDQIIDAIQKEFDRDLTLEECATRLHYNSFYLSSVFKKETNMTFSEYLANYRFQIAKKWLVETDMPIKSIAEKLTYTNAQNFIRYFRKLEGITPGQYRAKFSFSEK